MHLLALNFVVIFYVPVHHIAIVVLSLLLPHLDDFFNDFRFTWCLRYWLSFFWRGRILIKGDDGFGGAGLLKNFDCLLFLSCRLPVSHVDGVAREDLIPLDLVRPFLGSGTLARKEVGGRPVSELLLLVALCRFVERHGQGRLLVLRRGLAYSSKPLFPHRLCIDKGSFISVELSGNTLAA